MSGQFERSSKDKRTGFTRWALVVGSVYASLTLFVAVMAVVRVTAADPQGGVGYAADASVQSLSGHVTGDFWPTGRGPGIGAATV